MKVPLPSSQVGCAFCHRSNWTRGRASNSCQLCPSVRRPFARTLGNEDSVPLAALGSKRARPEPPEYLGTSPAPPAAFGCARVEAARPAPALLIAVGPTRSWESKSKAQPLLPPSSAPTAQPQPLVARPPAPPDFRPPGVVRGSPPGPAAPGPD